MSPASSGRVRPAADQIRIPAVIMRGGTSKGVFFHGGALPPPGELRDAALLYALGSPDPFRQQLDGLGGATSSTSKVVIVTPSARPDADVDYLFGQVSIDRALVDYSGNCGNLAAAIGPFAIEEGLVPATGCRTRVRMWPVNSGRLIIARCPTRGGLPVVEGGFSMAGVARAGAEIRVEFVEPGATACGALLPTGREVDMLAIPGFGRIRATLIDAGIPLVLVHAADLALPGTELPDELNRDGVLLRRLEAIRGHAAVAMGLAASPEEATRLRPASPKVALVSKPADYTSTTGEVVAAGGVDLVARAVSMGKVHHAFPVTAAVATATAAVVPGSIPHETAGGPAGQRARGHADRRATPRAGAAAGAGGRHDAGASVRSHRDAARSSATIRIGHPAGAIAVEAAVRLDAGSWVAERAAIGRTARRLMEGFVRIPAPVVPGWSPPRSLGAGPEPTPGPPRSSVSPFECS